MLPPGIDTIKKFELASERRIAEAAHLVAASRNLCAIYILGYAIEMLITAAYFRLQGYAPTRPIWAEERDRFGARSINYGFEIAHQHDFLGWARLMVEDKRALSPPDDPTGAPAGYKRHMGQSIINNAARAYDIWRPGLRYSPDEATADELREVQEPAEWFRDNYPSL